MDYYIMSYTCCRKILIATLLFSTFSCQESPINLSLSESESDLRYEELAKTWDEGFPLGNATVGTLVWQNDSSIHLSLDRTDLWDLRHPDSLSGDNYKFSWVKEHIKNKNYRPVQIKFDDPYDRMPAPSKIPGGALEFPLKQLGKSTDARLLLNNALCQIKWESGAILQTFVHATRPVGWFYFSNVDENFVPQIVAPIYKSQKVTGEDSPVTGQSIQRLGYDQGVVQQDGNKITYHQKGYKDFYYDIVVEWERQGTNLVGVWSVTSSLSPEKAENETRDALKRGFEEDFCSHMNFWNNYWAQSSVTLPDSVLQKQYDNEMYKFGSATRENSYPISLQAVWTADNGKLPPWKGDYHHDLNTQLSYWPAYIGNHLQEGLGYLNTLWNQRDNFRKYTQQYYELPGINIPGVCTLDGDPMGGWIQYAMSPTVGAWVAQHFYLHWKYSSDRNFLANRAYPFIKDVATFLEKLSIIDKDGHRTLEYSSSPEIFDNSLKAWFPTITNYDLSLMRFIFNACAETAGELNLKKESVHWKSLSEQLPDYSLDSEGGLAFADGVPYSSSHRHFSHAMSIHPLGLIDYGQGEKEKQIIEKTLARLEKVGPDYWCGYSYSWLANMYARAFKGEKAAEALRVFAECFCLKNTFHANGDQTRSGKSRFTYRPFTLEGNFAFASGVQEMLLQSHTGIVRVFPAIPADWKNVRFENLRAMGAFLVSATLENGKVTALKIYSEQGNDLKLLSPIDGKVLNLKTHKGQTIEII